MKPTIRIVEVEKVPSDCPFCNERVLIYGNEEDDEDYCEITTAPCPHTLFIATDADFEYRSDIFNENLKIKDEDDLWNLIEDSEEDMNIDSLTNKVSIPNSVKFASYESAPSFFGVYIGFAPLKDE
jgi:hypothetical protein